MPYVHSTPGARRLVAATSAAFIVLLSGEAALAQGAPTAKSFEGVWRITKVVRTGANAGTNTHPQPGLEIFYRGYYSLVRDNSSEPRKASPPVDASSSLTDAEKIARFDEWAPFAASAGTYEVRGDTLVTHNIVAKQPVGMTATEEATIKFEGADTFVASAKSPPGAPASQRQTTYTRVR
jgi:hypothetical protein